MRLIEELKRRNVFRVAALYVVGSWLILQIGDLLFDLMGLPDFALRIVLGILLLGFPAALVLAWVYELTPEGVKRESEVDRTASLTGNTGRKLNIAVIVAVVLALGAIGLQQVLPDVDQGPELAAEDVEMGSGSFSAENEPDPISDSRISIAVLPFSDLSPEGDQGYFADGISEEILNLLAGVAELKVASRTSSFAFKGQSRNIRSIADELGVGHVLEGSVRKAGERLRITAQLIRTETDEHLWSETYDRNLVDIFAIQEDIASAILAALGEALGLTLDADGIEVPAATTDLTAYELYLEGRERFVRRTDLRKAIENLEQAVELDPNFARAWGLLAAVYGIAPSWFVRDRPYREMADEAADRALAIEPGLSIAHATKGLIRYFDVPEPTWSASLVHLDRAIELDPRNSTTLFWRALVWIQLGYFDRALADLERCLEVDPAYQICAKRTAVIEMIRGDDAAAMALVQSAEEAGNTASSARILPLLVRRGQRFAALLILRRIEDRGAGESVCPLRDFLDLLEGRALPDDRIEAVLDCARENRIDEPFLVAGRWDELAPLANQAQLWQRHHPEFMRSEAWQRIAAQLNMFEYWREHGPPPQCRAVDETFQCELP